MSNALKYTDAGGRVTIEAQETEQSVQLTVSDTGIGMSPDEVEQACDTFWRSESALEAAKPGFGLGLILVREVVDAHAGSLAIESTPGLGTSVTSRCDVPLVRIAASSCVPLTRADVR